MVDRNHSDLTNIIATGLADNTSGAITAQVLRDVMTDTVDTIFAVVPASGTTSTGLGASDGISPVTLGVGSGMHFAAGTNVTTTLSDAGNGSGVVTIGLGPLGDFNTNPSGLMSSFQFGREDSDGNGQRVTIHDSSGIMLRAGTNMEIDFAIEHTLNPGGSGVFTFNATLPSGNAITSVSAGGDTGYTWSSQDNIVSDDVAETLALVAGTGIELDIDATNNAVRFSVSGSLPLATHPSTTPASSSDNASNTFIQDITLDAYGHITGIGTNTVPSGNYHPVIDSSSRLDASLIGANGNVSNAEYGYLASVSSDIQAQIDAKGSGTMSKLHVGATTMPEGTGDGERLTDGSGLFFAAGDNMTITLTNDAHGSGVLTFASTAVAEASGNAFGAISTGSDIGYTWGASNVTALAGSQALNIIPASGISIDTDNTNSAIRIGVTGTIAVNQGGTGATSFGNDEVIYKPNGGSSLSSSSRMKFDGQTFTVAHTSGPGITIENTNADGAAGIFKFSKDGSSPATNDNIGTIEWSSEDSGSVGTTYAKILGSIADVDAGSEQGALKFFVAELDGTLTEGLNITGIDNDGDITVDVTTHDGANGGLKLGGTLVTATAAELNALDGFTGSSIGSGTMSKFHVGSTTQVDPTQISMGDGSGLFFAAGSNMTITTTNTDGSGIITFASSASGGSGSGTMSKLHVGSTTQVDPNQISLGDGSGLFFAAGDNMTITTTNTDGSGIITFASSASGGSGSGTMSRLKVGASDGLPQLQQLGDGSGLFFVAGDNMSVTLTNNDAGSGILTFASAVSTNNPTFTGNITIGSAEISETELEILDGATLSTTELNYVDGVTSAIQTQLDTKGSGTMSRLKIGASDGLPQLQQLGDGSGLFFAAGSNMAITLTNNDAGSGILTFASDVSTNNPTFTGNITIGSAEISETELEILDGATLTTTELNYVDGVTSAIQTQLDTKGSGTMSKFHVGSTTQVDPTQISMGDGSGLFFAAGSNMTVTTTNTDGSGVVTFASTGGSSVSFGSDNQIPYMNADGDDFEYESNLTWGHGSNILLVNGDIEIAAKLFHKDDSNTFLHFVGADDFRIVVGGDEYLSIDMDSANEVCINENGESVDFRVESNSNANMLFVDGSTDRVGIAADTPMNVLQVNNGGGDGDDGIMIVSTDTTTSDGNLLGGIGFDSVDGNVPSSITEASAYIAAYAAENHAATDKGGDLVFGTTTINDDDDTTSHEWMRIKDDGTIEISGDLIVGVDDIGHDVKFFGATAGRYLLWDEANDRLKFRDNVKAVFGQGNDLEIYHDATDSYITSSTNKLKILTDKLRINNAADDESIIDGEADGAVKLYYDGNTRIETTSAGVTVSGNVQTSVHDHETTDDINVDFDEDSLQKALLNGNVDIDTAAANKGAGKSIVIKILCDSSARNFTWNSSWIFIGEKPTSIAASKTALLSMTCFGTNETDVICSYAVQD